jgi:acid ceramidase
MDVDLSKEPVLRWKFSEEQLRWARELQATYQRDLGLPASLVAELSRPVIGEAYWNEMVGIAEQAKVPIGDVVCGNLYYDALKSVLMGCTAFAVDTPEGPLHARNLDWWTENDALRRYTMLTRFTGGAAGEFSSVGWPGFTGVFSAMAPGRFAVTLNAVISDEPVRAASPVVFLLRQVLEEAADFRTALRLLSTVPVASDSLLLLTGVRLGEMVVIERTPTRSKVRFSENGCIFVTNDYRALETGLRRMDSVLQATACRRHERISELVTQRAPGSAGECLLYLEDPEVRMGMTVQQMVFQASVGACLVR